VQGVPLGNTEAVGWSLYRDYLLPFEVVSIVLLVAMIGAIVMGRKETGKEGGA
jgi:NADH-quinone oxidoreductase subunit J